MGEPTESRSVRWVESVRHPYKSQGRGKPRVIDRQPPMSELGKRVAEILAQVFGGIYNAPVNVQRVDWANDSWVNVNLQRRRSLATFDFDHLTQLVVLCHDQAIRLTISATGPQMLELMFHQRRHKQDGEDLSISEWHPTLEQAAARVRGAKS